MTFAWICVASALLLLRTHGWPLWSPTVLRAICPGDCSRLYQVKHSLWSWAGAVPGGFRGLEVVEVGEWEEDGALREKQRHPPPCPPTPPFRWPFASLLLMHGIPLYVLPHLTPTPNTSVTHPASSP